MKIEEGECWLFVYRNGPSIVMGRFQNPWIECDFDKIKSDRVHLVRRQSGGGTVYHDINNLNYCFIHGTREHHSKINHQIVVNALEGIGISAFITKRSDLKVISNGEKKISGSAFKQKKDRSLHHGTLLINTDLAILNRYLKSKHAGAKSKSTKSNPSSVINLTEIEPGLDYNSILEALKNSFGKYFGASSCEAHQVENYIDLDREYLAKLVSQEWVLYETPYFSVDQSVEDFHISFEAKKGVFISVNIEWPQLDGYNIGLLERFLDGKKIHKDTHTSVGDEFKSYVECSEEVLEKISEKLKLLGIFN
jgi:lipoate-protein ligase A